MPEAHSRDGTEIGYETSGEGPPLLLVHGTTADKTRWRPLLPHLEPHFTVHAMDRRGRGGSSDASPYQVTREFEDVAAVIDSVAETTGRGVYVYGHSFGAYCCLGAATMTSNIERLVLYEPPLGSSQGALPPGIDRRLDALLRDDRREEVVETFFREVVLMPEEELGVFKSLPSWQARIEAAHTIVREFTVDLEGTFPLKATSGIDAPTLLLVGGESPEVMKADTKALADALPNARSTVLSGQQHVADVIVPEEFAKHLVGFFLESNN